MPGTRELDPVSIGAKENTVEKLHQKTVVVDTDVDMTLFGKGVFL